MILILRAIQFLFFILLLSTCYSNVNKDNNSQDLSVIKVEGTNVVDEHIYLDTFSRAVSLAEMEAKVSDGIPLIVHVRIPLCDNDNQGIVRVGRLIGNGLDLNNNLYWGAKYGLKNHFRKHTNWKMLQSIKDVNNVILERVVFYKEFDNNAKVYLVADAYRGDKMKECLGEYTNSLAGNRSETITVGTNHLRIGSDADLLVFNGHNGLMDYDMDEMKSKDGKLREASVIGCVSHEYFKGHLQSAQTYPVLMTTSLMAPEAYVLEAVINSWASLDSESIIRSEAGKAYHKYQKCGINGATNLFKTGW